MAPELGRVADETGEEGGVDVADGLHEAVELVGFVAVGKGELVAAPSCGLGFVDGGPFEEDVVDSGHGGGL